MTEETEPHPEDSYGIAKLAVERELQVSHEMFGLDYCIFRPHNVYGERQNLGDKYRNVLGIFMNRLMQGEEMIVFGDGEQCRAFTYVKDIVPGIAQSVLLGQAHNQLFNIGADKPWTVNRLAEIVAAAMGVPAKIRHVEERKEVKVAYSDHTRFNQVFADTTYTPLDQGVALMAAWAKQEGIRKSKDFENIEIAKNLPPVWK
jgi:UDP-glucose 4-epimerase